MIGISCPMLHNCTDLAKSLKRKKGKLATKKKKEQRNQQVMGKKC
jgi:hypothetical protein